MFQAVAENQPANKNRMTAQLSQFATRLRLAGALPDREFNALALELFALQFKYNHAYRIIC